MDCHWPEPLQEVHKYTSSRGPNLSLASPSPIFVHESDQELPGDDFIFNQYVLFACEWLENNGLETKAGKDEVLAYLEVVTKSADKDCLRVVRAVVSLVAHGEEAVRAAVVSMVPRIAVSLTGINCATEMAIMQLSHEAPYVRLAALQLLQNISVRSNKRAVDAVGSKLQDADSQVRLGAAKALNYMFRGECSEDGYPESLRNIVLPLLKDGDASIRSLALEVLSKIAKRGDEYSIQAVMPLLDDPDPVARRKAIHALTKIPLRGDQRVFQAVKKKLSDRERPVRKLAVESLPSIVERGNAAALAAAYSCSTDNEGDVRIGAIKSVGRLANKGDRCAIDHLITELHNESDNPIKYQALTSLASIVERGDKNAVKAVCAQLLNREWFVRLEALKTLAQIASARDQKTKLQIQKLLQDREFDVRSEAEQTIVQIYQHDKKNEGRSRRPMRCCFCACGRQSG